MPRYILCMIYDVGYIPAGARLWSRPGVVGRAAVREPIDDASKALNRARLLLDEHDATGLACEVVDVSPHGCRIALSNLKGLLALRKIGTECILELNGETWVQVRVCWFAQEFRGLKIIRKLPRN